MKLQASPLPASLLEPLQSELVAKVRPQKSWLYSTGGRPHEPKTDPLAAQVVAFWRPEQATKPQPMRPGWAGLASYRLPYADGDKHLKVTMARPEGEEATYEQIRKGAMGEAARANWAGERGLGPKVHFTHERLGAFVTDFIDGRIPTLDETRGPLLHTNLSALANLHRQELQELPPGGHTNWLLEGPRVQSDLNEAQAPARPAAFCNALLQIEAGLERFVARQPFTPVAIHDDYKPDNTLLAGERLFLLDWNNLRVADAAIDLGHFAVMADIGAGEVVTSYVDDYLALQQQAGSPLAGDDHLRASTQAYTGLFRLRNLAFYNRWESSRPKTAYLLHQLIDDVKAMEKNVFTELGLRPASLQDAA